MIGVRSLQVFQTSQRAATTSPPRVIGVLQVLNKKHITSVFTEDDVRLLRAFAAQAAVAISNSRLYHDTKKSLTSALREQRNLKFLLAFTRSLCADLQLNNVAQQLRQQILELLDADATHIFMLDDKQYLDRLTEDDVTPAAAVTGATAVETSTGAGTVADLPVSPTVTSDVADTPKPAPTPASTGGASTLLRRRFPWTRGLVGRVAQTGRGVLLSSRVSDEPGYDANTDASAHGSTPASVLILPIIYDPLKEIPSPSATIVKRPSKPTSGDGRALPTSESTPSEQHMRPSPIQRHVDKGLTAEADPTLVANTVASVALPSSAKIIGVVLAILDAPSTSDVVSPRPNGSRGTRSRAFGPDDEHLLRSLCAQAALSLIKSQQLTHLVEDVTRKQGAQPRISDSEEVAKRLDSADRGKSSADDAVIDLAADDIDPFHFHMADIALLHSIGVGSYGEVFAARLRGQVVAVKKLNTHGMLAEHVDAFCSEASLMCQLKHPNLVQFVGAVPQPPHLCIITEYCARGSLYDLLKDYKVQLTFDDKIKFCRDAAAGMMYMHTCNPVILHRDLKTDNLLVDSALQVKVADFGLSRFRSDRKTMTQVGTPVMMAPEVMSFMPSSGVSSTSCLVGKIRRAV